MKKKILLLIGLLILLTGCNADVTLTIDEEYIKENISINTYANNEYNMATIKGAYRKNLPAYSTDIIVDTESDTRKKGVSYYNYEIKELTNGYNINYSYNFKLNKYYNARSIKEAYKNSNVVYDEDSKILTINTDTSGCEYFGIYPELDSLTINIKTAYKVLDSNADSCNDGVCKWYLTKNNNKYVYIKLNLGDKDNTIIEDVDVDEDNTNIEEEVEDKSSSKVYIYVLVFGGIFGFIIVVIFANKNFDKRG